MPQKERRKGNAFSRTDKQSLENYSFQKRYVPSWFDVGCKEQCYGKSISK